jgi:hypothetical protein
MSSPPPRPHSALYSTYWEFNTHSRARNTTSISNRSTASGHGYKPVGILGKEEYAGVIKQLKKGYPIRLVAKSEGVGVSTVQRMKKKFVDVA